jgi:hypothetical protein
MNFGDAIAALKQGKMVRRTGWNGKGMHLYLEEGFSMSIRDGMYSGAVRSYEPAICMFTAQQKHQPGWLASQADMLAEDWQVAVEDGPNERPSRAALACRETPARDDASPHGRMAAVASAAPRLAAQADRRTRHDVPNRRHAVRVRGRHVSLLR